MTNLEYLEKMKKAEEEWLNDDVIKNISGDNPKWDMEGMNYRKIKALEIIAEELIKHNVTAGCAVTALENIDAGLDNINANLRR